MASDKPLGDVSETRRRLPPIQWRRTTASTPGSPFRRASGSAANGGMVASDAEPCMCAPEAGAATDPASVPVEGHGHRFRRGVDQPDYVRLLRCFASFDRVALHPSVTRRGALYGLHPRLVSIDPSGTKVSEADPRPSQRSFGAGPSPGTGSEPSSRMPSGPARRCPRESADPCAELVLLRLHTWNAEESLTSKSTRRESPIGRKRPGMSDNVK